MTWTLVAQIGVLILMFSIALFFVMGVIAAFRKANKK